MHATSSWCACTRSLVRACVCVNLGISLFEEYHPKFSGVLHPHKRWGAAFETWNECVDDDIHPATFLEESDTKEAFGEEFPGT